MTIEITKIENTIEIIKDNKFLEISSFGLQGLKGDKGDQGEKGEQGVQGEKGEQGDPATNLVTSVNGQIGEVIIKTSDTVFTFFV